MSQNSGESRRWGPERRSALVLRILRWDEPLEEVARKAGVPASDAERWTRDFVSAGERALLAGSHDPVRAPTRIRDLERKLGEMALEMDRLRKQVAGATDGATDGLPAAAPEVGLGPQG